MSTVGVLGAGAAGASIAHALGKSGHTVLLWDKNKDVLNEINTHHEVGRTFPGLPLSENLKGEPSLYKVAKACSILFVALPADAHTEVATQLSSELTSQHILVQMSSGLRKSDGAFMTTVWDESITTPVPQVVLAGPCFSLELIEERFTAFTLASTHTKARESVAALFTAPFVRPYYSDDPIGAQIGSAIRNVLAIAAGICNGLNLGINAQAAVLCRGLAEMLRLGEALGAQEKTMMGLAGMGDVILHATSTLSRNYRLGQRLAKGIPLDKAIEDVGLAEGVTTARMVAYIATVNGVDLAIISAIDGILSGDITPEKVYELLISRPLQSEF